MKKIEVGRIYMAHAFENAERIITKNSGFYHFKILETKEEFVKILDLSGQHERFELQNIYLGLKIGVKVSPYDTESQCFWFDENGIHDSWPIKFELKRRLNKTC